VITPPDIAELVRIALSRDRETKIKMLGRAAEDLLHGRPLSPLASAYLGAALLAWLESGAGRSLEKDFLKITRRHSHATPQRVWASIRPSSTMRPAIRLNDDDASHNVGLNGNRED
jgi:hypothetical protein